MTAWLSTFYIGTDITYPGDDFAPLSTWLSNKDIPIDPDWIFSPHSAAFDKGDGGRAGVGFPRAAWSWAHRQDAHIEIFQTLCPGLSASVYIRTPTNTVASGLLVWRTYLCQMLMPPEDIDYQAGQALGFVLEFRHMVVQAEAV